MISPEKEPSKEVKNPLWDIAAIGGVVLAAFFGLRAFGTFRKHL